MKYTPDINVVSPFDVKNRIGVALELPDPQTRQIQFVCESWRSCRGITTNMAVSFLQRVNHAERSCGGPFIQVIGQSLFHIPMGLFSRDDRFEFHGAVMGGVA